MAVIVRVHNFQSIKDATVVVDGFTVATGKNNRGKTALQRAIRGVFQNTPGTAFVRQGEEKCSVEIRFEDGNVVVWEKGTKTKPTYKVNGKTIHPGRDVPDEVRDLMVVPVMAGGREHWPSIAPQIVGQVFLLDQPGSVIAEAVADVERVGHLNRAMMASEKDRRKAEDKLRVRKEDLVEAETEVAFFEGLDPAVIKVEELEAVWEQASRIQRALQALGLMQKRHKAAVATVTHLEGVQAVNVPDAATAVALDRELTQLKGLKVRLTTASTRAVVLAGVEAVAIPTDLTQVEDLAGDHTFLVNLRERVRSVAEELGKLQRAEKLLDQELVTVASDLEGVLDEIGECPTCGKEHTP